MRTYAQRWNVHHLVEQLTTSWVKNSCEKHGISSIGRMHSIGISILNFFILEKNITKISKDYKCNKSKCLAFSFLGVHYFFQHISVITNKCI